MGVHRDFGNSTCIFCCKNPPIANSHVFPKFLFRSIKKDAVSKGLRDSTDASVEEQDGWTADLLCTDCEQLFSKEFEGPIAKDFFYPLIERKSQNVKYDERLTLFFLSVFFRHINFAVDSWRYSDSAASSLSLLLGTKLHDFFAKGDFPDVNLYITWLPKIEEPGKYAPGINQYFLAPADAQWLPEGTPETGPVAFLKIPHVAVVFSEKPLETLETHVAQARIGKSGQFGTADSRLFILDRFLTQINERAVFTANFPLLLTAEQRLKMKEKVSSHSNPSDSMQHQAWVSDNDLAKRTLNFDDPKGVVGFRKLRLINPKDGSVEVDKARID